MEEMRTYEGNLVGAGLKIGIIVSRFNHFVTDRLLEGALDGLTRHGITCGDVEIVRVPGTFEVPVATQKMARSAKYDVIICLGAVIRGGTPHFDYIAAEVTKGVAAVSLDSGLPVIYGIITCDTIEQAIERAGTKHGNKGYEAAVAAIEMGNLFKTMSE